MVFILSLHPTTKLQDNKDKDYISKLINSDFGSEIEISSRIFGFNPDNNRKFTYIGRTKRGGDFLLESVEDIDLDSDIHIINCYINGVQFRLSMVNDLVNVMDQLPSINKKVSTIFDYIMNMYNLKYSDIINGTEKSLIRNIRLKNILNK